MYSQDRVWGSPHFLRALCCSFASGILGAASSHHALGHVRERLAINSGILLALCVDPCSQNIFRDAIVSLTRITMAMLTRMCQADTNASYLHMQCKWINC